MEHVPVPPQQIVVAGPDAEISLKEEQQQQQQLGKAATDGSLVDEAATAASGMDIDMEATRPFGTATYPTAAANVQILLDSGRLGLFNTMDASSYVAATHGKLTGTTLEYSQQVIHSGPPNIIDLQLSSRGQCISAKPNRVTQVDQPFKKKRKTWNTEKNNMLAAAVQVYGVDGWTKISKEVFNGEWPAPWLSKQWERLKVINRLDKLELAAEKGLTRQISSALDMAVTLASCSAKLGSVDLSSKPKATSSKASKTADGSK